MGRYVGIDVSLTATGIAVVDRNAHSVVHTVRSKGARGATLPQRGSRLRDLQRAIVSHPRAALATVVAVETPAYNQTGGSHHDRSGLWWLIVDDLQELGYDVVEISTTTVKKYATGKGNASKDEVLAAVVRRYPNIAVTNNNEADALILAAIVARLYGEPIEENLPQSHLVAMDVLRPNVGQEVDPA